MTQHGTYVHGLGWADVDGTHVVYKDTAEKVTKTRSAPPPPPVIRPDGGWRTEPLTAEEKAQEKAHQLASAFWPSEEMESLRRLRSSPHADERADFRTLVAGGTRTALAGYEEGLAAYLAAGNALPENVAPLS